MVITYNTRYGKFKGTLHKVTATQIQLIVHEDGYIKKFNRKTGHEITTDTWYFYYISDEQLRTLEDNMPKIGKKNKNDIYIYQKKA